MKEQMELFEPVEGAFDEGGLMEEGGSVDPVSGNDVPVGSTQEEVRDDIPAQLSEGEFVLPADVVRFIGLEKIMALRDEAKAGLARMEAMGQMGNSEEAIIPDGVPFDINDLDMEDDGVVEYAQGGVVHAQAGTFVQPQGFTGISGTQQSQFAGYQPQYTAYTPPPIPGGQQLAQQYTPAAQQFTPTINQQAPTFTGMTGVAAPSPGGYDELKTYVNDAGMEMQIPFKDGKPIYPIPEGYKAKTEKIETAATTTTTGTGVETARDTGGDDDSTAPKFSTTDVSGIGYDRSKIGNKDLLDAINKSTGALAKSIGTSTSLGAQLAQKTGVLGGIKAENAILGGVIDQFRGGDVSFASGRKVGNYDITTELHNLTDIQQQQIADVFKSVSEKMDDLYTKTNEKGDKVAKTQAEVTSSLRVAAERLGISTTFGKTNLSKRNDTLAREIAKAEADKKAREKRQEQAMEVGEQRKQEAEAMAASLPSGYKISTEGKSAAQIRKEVGQQRTKQKQDQARAEREAAQRRAEEARSGDDGGVQTSQAGQELAASGGYGVGDSTFGALAKGGLVEQMEKSGLSPKK